MSLQQAMVLMNRREYGRAIAILTEEAVNESRTPLERAAFCEWLAVCHRSLEDYRQSGDWYLEAIKRIFSFDLDTREKAKRSLPLSEKALECYKEGGDTVDVMAAAKLKQKLMDLSR